MHNPVEVVFLLRCLALHPGYSMTIARVDLVHATHHVDLLRIHVPKVLRIAVDLVVLNDVQIALFFLFLFLHDDVRVGCDIFVGVYHLKFGWC